MNETRVDRWIADLLDDPLVSLMIKADKVDRAALAADLRKLAPSGEGRAVGGVRALLSQSPSRRARPSSATAHVASAARGLAAGCWSCAK
jgi:hypothetical protein